MKSKYIKIIGELALMVYPCECYDRLDREKQEKEMWERRLRSSRIPPLYWQATLDINGRSPYEKEIVPWLRILMDNGLKRGFGLIGDVGVGKTHYVCAVLLDLLRRGKKCLFLNVSEYYDSLKSSFSKKESTGSETYDDFIIAAKEIDFVAFDDIGAEYNTQWTVDELGKIINHRYNYCLPTIWTSNLRVNELTCRIGKRTVDRLREMGSLKLIEGDSIRDQVKRQSLL